MDKFDEASLHTLVKTLFPSLLSKIQLDYYGMHLRNSDFVLSDKMSLYNPPCQHGAATVDDNYSFDMGSRKGVVGLFEGENWSVRTMQNIPRAKQASFALTNDCGVIVGGRDGTTPSLSYALSSCERYSDFYNAWANVSDLPYARNKLIGATLTSDLGFTAGGSNESGYLCATSERFSLSSDTWTSRSAYTTNRSSAAVFCLTKETCVMAGGLNASYLSRCDLYSDNINAWKVITSMPEVQGNNSGISLTDNVGIVFGGQNDTYDLTLGSYQYWKSGNVWGTTRTTILSYRTSAMNNGITMSSHQGVIAGGYSHAYTWYSFNEITEIYSHALGLWHKSIPPICQRSYTSSISLSYSSGLMVGGQTRIDPTTFMPPERYTQGTAMLNWLDNGYCLNTSLCEQQIPGVDGVWSISPSILNQARTHPAGVGTKFSSLCSGGENAGWSPLTSCEKWNDTTWSLAGDMNVGRSGLTGIGIASYAMIMGGSNNSGILATCELWNNTTWLTSPSLVRNNFCAGSVGSVGSGGLIIGGNNGYILPYTEKWASSVWATTNSLNVSRYYIRATGNISSCIAFGGSNTPNTATTKLDTNEIWDGSAWSTTTSLLVPLYTPAAAGNTNDTIIAGGANSANVATQNGYIWNGSVWGTTSGLNIPKVVPGSGGDSKNALAYAGTTSMSGLGRTDSTETWLSQKYCPIPAGKTVYVNTTRLSNQKEPIDKIYVSAIYSKHPDEKVIKQEINIEKIWTMASNLPATKYGLGSCGTTSAALAMGGAFINPSSGWAFKTTEIWLGSTWASTSALASSEKFLLSACGTTISALAWGGAKETILSTTDKWATNSWTTTSSLNIGVVGPSGCGGDASNAMTFGGYNNTSVPVGLTKSEKWTASSWSTTTPINTGRYYAAGCGTPADALIFGGYINSTTMTNSTEIWDGSTWSTTGSLIQQRANLAGFGDKRNALAFAGEDSEYNLLNSCERWNGSVWLTSSSLSILRCQLGGCGNNNGGLAYGGRNNSYSLENTEKAYNLISITDVDQIIKYPSITYDVSLDDGWTYKEDLPFNVYSETDGLSPINDDYRLKLRFELARDASINTWSHLVETPQYRTWPTAIKITNDTSLMIAGRINYLGGYNYTGSNYRYTVSSNSFTSRQAQTIIYYNGIGLQVSPYVGLSVGGSNSSTGWMSNNNSFSDTLNIWQSRTAITIPRAGGVPLKFTFNNWLVVSLGVSSTGYTGVTHRFASETDVWSSLASNSYPRKDGGSCNFESYEGNTFGGQNSSAYLTYHEKYRASVNVWNSKSVMWYTAADFASFSLSSETALQAGGQNDIRYYNISNKYYNSQDVWTPRSDMPETRVGCAGWSFNPNMGIVVGGSSEGNLGNQQLLKYTDGETMMFGFTVVGPIKKQNPMIRQNDDVYIETDRPWTHDPMADPRFPLKAINPDPEDDETDVSDYGTVLSWENGGLATSYDVYLKAGGTDPGAGDKVSTGQTETTYDPGTLTLGTIYRWKINSFNAYGSAVGDIWQFTTMSSPSGSLGLFGGGWNGSGTVDTIQWFRITNKSNSSLWGNLTYASHLLGASGNNTYGLFIGGTNGSIWSQDANVMGYMQYTSYSTKGSIDIWGNLSHSRQEHACCSNQTRTLISGGSNTTAFISNIEYIDLSTTGDASNFGSLTTVRDVPSSCSSTTRGLFFAGENGAILSNIEYVTISTTGNSSTFGNINRRRVYSTSCASNTIGIIAGGSNGNKDSMTVPISLIEYVYIATTGSSSNWGNLSISRSSLASASDKIYGVFSGGSNGSSSYTYSTMDYITFSSSSNALSFGDLSSPMHSLAGTSNCHGGLT